MAGIVPKAIAGRARAGVAAMVIEDDLHADLVGIGDDLVHDLERGQADEIRILGIVDALGRARGVQHVGGVGQADGVEPQLLHLLHHVLIAAGPQTVRGLVLAFKAEPVHAGDLHGVAVGVHDLVALGGQPAGVRARPGRIALQHRAVGNGHRRQGRCRVIAIRRHAVDGEVGRCSPPGALHRLEAEAGRLVIRQAAIVGRVPDHIVAAGVGDDLGVPDAGDVEGGIEPDRPAIQGRVAGRHRHDAGEAGVPVAVDRVVHGRAVGLKDRLDVTGHDRLSSKLAIAAFLSGQKILYLPAINSEKTIIFRHGARES